MTENNHWIVNYNIHNKIRINIEKVATVTDT